MQDFLRIEGGAWKNVQEWIFIPIDVSSEKWLQVASNMIEYSSYNFAFEVENIFFFHLISHIKNLTH